MAWLVVAVLVVNGVILAVVVRLERMLWQQGSQLAVLTLAVQGAKDTLDALNTELHA